MDTPPLIRADGPILVFGGPYSNLHATAAVLAEADRLGIAPGQTICTGDLTAYCGDPVTTIELVLVLSVEEGFGVVKASRTCRNDERGPHQPK